MEWKRIALLLSFFEMIKLSSSGQSSTSCDQDMCHIKQMEEVDGKCELQLCTSESYNSNVTCTVSYAWNDTSAFQVYLDNDFCVPQISMDYCSSSAELLLPYYGCTCPTCQCSNVDEVDYQIYENMCYKCTCSSYSEGNGWNCYQIGSTYQNPSCPPPSCSYTTDYGYNDTLYVGQGVTLKDSNGNCTKYCVCNGANNLVCASGYNNIISNNILSTQFWQQCGYALAPCITGQNSNQDTSTWKYSNNYCSSCPYCGCDSPNTWFLKTTTSNSNSHCEGLFCDDEETYVDCVNYTCNEFYEYSQSNNLGSENAEYMNCSVNSLQCYNSYNDNLNYCLNNQESYCGISLSYHDSFPGDDSDSNYEDDAGCKENYFCDAFDAINGCSYGSGSVNVVSYDCDSGERTIYPTNWNETLQCCDSDGCNSDLSNSCSHSSVMDSFYGTLYTCTYASIANNSLIGELLFCDENDTAIEDAINSGETTYCDLLDNYFSLFFTCYCSAFSILHANVDSQYQNYLLLQVQDIKQSLDFINQVYQCNAIYTCNIQTGVSGYSRTSYSVQFDLNAGNDCDISNDTSNSDIHQGLAQVFEESSSTTNLNVTDFTSSWNSNTRVVTIDASFSTMDNANTFKTYLTNDVYQTIFEQAFSCSVTTSNVGNVQTETVANGNITSTTATTTGTNPTGTDQPSSGNYMFNHICLLICLIISVVMISF